MVTIVVVLVTGVVVNLQVTNSPTMLIDTNPTQRGVLEEMVPDLVQEVPEVVKESW
tara:strand:+ start:253 stop:420 length:168 start_codon:yes stop_codon:yes gene_type:complete